VTAAAAGTPIRVLVADDQKVVRDGLSVILGLLPGIEVVGAAVDGEDAFRQALAMTPDVVLMDLHMPKTGGLQATRELAAAAPEVAILVLSMFDNDESLFTAMRAGARGYLVKGADQEQIERAIRAVAAGDVTFGAGIARRALGYFSTAPATSRAARPFPELTDRELEVLELVADGRANAWIASHLFLSDKTVRNHVSAILAKLQAADRGEAGARAREAGLGRTAGP
jgi:DNA-binding NarL/FixJ family response regulator